METKLQELLIKLGRIYLDTIIKGKTLFELKDFFDIDIEYLKDRNEITLEQWNDFCQYVITK